MFNKDLYYKKYLKYKNKYINLQSQIGGKNTNIFNVTVGIGVYIVNDGNKPQLNMIKGQTYTFTLDVARHPFYIQTSSEIYNQNTVYSNGVTGNGTKSGTLTFVVPTDAPATLYYVCEYHPNMGNQINIT